MENNTMTITRGLAELKLLDKRINHKISESNFITANKKSNKKINGIYTVDEFSQNAKAQYQSVLDLIERRKKIKTAIVNSNANTIVNIAGKEMTVADAIERKESIQYEQTLLNTMRKQYSTSLGKMQIENEKVNAKLDELLNTSFGKENKQKVSDDEISIISKPYLEQNEFVLINPLEIHKKIESLNEEIDNFISEVDYVLSESNSITRITIE